jgi:hypothetical protein
MANNEMFRLVCLDLPTEPFFQSYSKMIHRYTDLDMVMAYIEFMRQTPVFFIVSDRLAEEALSRLKLHRHVRDVFIFNHSSESLKINLEQHESLAGIFQCEDELDHAVQTRIVFMEKQALPFSVFDQIQRTSKDLANEFNAFLWYQVLFHTLRQMPADERAKDEMLQICSNYYQANPREEQIIQQYRKSSSEDQAIHW